MATQVIKSIGLTGRDYSTLAAFFAAIPSNLVTADQQWIGEVYNDGEIVTAGAQAMPAITVDATRNVILRAAAGHSFKDHASKATNASAYDPTKGAALRVSDSFVDAFDFGVSFTEVSGLQFKTSGTAFINVKLGTSINFHNNIVHNVDGRASIQANGVSCRIDNNLVLHPAVNYPGVYFNTTSGSASNNTLYAGGAGSASVGFAAAVAGMVYKNNVVFGFSGGSFNNAAASSANNYSDGSINAGTGNVTGLVLANVLVSTTDLRPKAGSVVINAGVAVSGITTDILGTAYSGGVDVGAYEYVAGSSPVSADLVVSYDIVAAASADLIVSYDVRAQVTKDLVVSYNIATASASVTSEAAENNNGTAWTTETAHYSWFPGGRVGSLGGITPIEGSKPLVGGALTVTGLIPGAGLLWFVVRAAAAVDDATYAQQLTAA